MKLHEGENVYYQVMPEMKRHSATIVSLEGEHVVLKPAGAQPKISKGTVLVISGSDYKHYNEVLKVDGALVTVKHLWSENRSYFRVDDFFPVISRKVGSEAQSGASKIFSGYGIEIQDEAFSDETVNPRLWKMLVAINSKLQMILERLQLESEGLINVKNKPVNLSASGIRFTMDEKVEVGDLLEIKMLLPKYPPTGILTYGNVVKVTDKEDGTHEVSLHFQNMDDEVRDEIIQYALKRQREIIKKERERTETK
jgi:hypothetical protein